MAVMMGKLYAALREANVPEDKATAAAEEVAGFENRLGKLDADVSLLKWMIGFNIALSVVVLGFVMRLGA